MHIARIQVEEGFLGGVDLKLTPGLNVLIGARGTGKTSVVELIRFALGLRANTSEFDRRARDHARSILASGQVTLTLDTGHGLVDATRAADDEEPRGGGHFDAVVFSQSEIEQVGQLADGRLQIIDGFLPQRKVTFEEAKLEADARSLTSQIASVHSDILSIEEQLQGLPELAQQLQVIEQQEASFAASSELAANQRLQLDGLSSEFSMERVKEEYLRRFSRAVEVWIEEIEPLSHSATPVEEWRYAGADPASDLRVRFSKSKATIVHSIAVLKELRSDTGTRLQEIVARRAPLETKARALRQQIEMLQEGAGRIARESSALKERHASLMALNKVLDDRKRRLSDLQSMRGLVLDTLDQLRRRRYDERIAIANDLNKRLRPRIKITVRRAGELTAYRQLIADALRGSGLRYGDLALTLAKEMSPRELLEAIESGNIEQIAHLTKISMDRAVRLASHFREGGLEDLAVCRVEDTVNFALLDGGDYKDLSHLSTGQRCTVVLPIILEHKDRIVVLDQPEDHIDNAFITDTIIKALRARSAQSQVIVSTHNANIPVLGEADLVVQMQSDGKRGYVHLAMPLETTGATDAITDLMEGGRLAFERRAAFYARH